MPVIRMRGGESPPHALRGKPTSYLGVIGYIGMVIVIDEPVEQERHKYEEETHPKRDQKHTSYSSVT
jgi:hypothetical protein